MIFPSSLIRYPRSYTGLSGFGIGADEMRLANPDNACAPGLTLINGSCFRSPGTQNTAYGPVAIPIAGPDSNLNTAQQLLRNAGNAGATCATENISEGPYSYEQNICRDATGKIIGGADNIAETAFVNASLRNPANPQIFTSTGATNGATPPPAAKPPAPAGNGSGAFGAQQQQPGQNPNTVQGSADKPAGGGEKEKAASTPDNTQLYLILGAALIGVVLLKGGR
jgi:hypothetical protein